MQEIVACPVCLCKEIKPVFSCKDFTVSYEIFNISECNACNFKFTTPRPDSKDIVKYYQSEDYISHSNTQKGILSKLYHIVRRRTIANKLRTINEYVSRGTILDIGCGTGEFLNYCKENNWQTLGIEPGLDARKQAQEKHNLSVNDEAYISQIPDNSFDVITLWHVLEHVHELNERVAELKRIIKDNGVVIIAVPNHTSYDAKHYKEVWAAYDLPRHLYHFSPATITKLFEKQELKCVKILPMKFDSFYVSMLSEKYLKGKINYARAFMIGLISNMNAGVKKNNTYSSQIYIFKK